MSVNFRELKSNISSRLFEIKGCGANKPGGGGFSAGNTCARSSTNKEALAKLDAYEGDFIDNPLDVDANPPYIDALAKFSSPQEFDAEVKKAPKKDVEISGLISDQSWLNKAGVAENILNPQKRNVTPVTVIDYKGKLYLSDGNHRVVAAFMRGEKRIRAAVVKIKDPQDHVS